MAENLTEVSAITGVWRPLTTAETQRAEALIGSAEREIARRWDLQGLLAAGKVSEQDVADVVCWLVIPVLGGPPAPGARSWQVSSGSESRSVTLDAAGNPRDPWQFADWMVRIFEGVPTSTAVPPIGHFPNGGRFDRIFPSWREEYP